MKRVFFTSLFLTVAFMLNAQTYTMGLDFGSDYETVYSKMKDKFGSAPVEKADGEHIYIKDIDYPLDGVQIKIITLLFSNIDGKHYLSSIAYNTEAMVMVYETDAAKIGEFNKYAVKQCNALAVKINERYKVANVAKKVDVSRQWTKLYTFNVDDNVTGEISAFFNAKKKLVAQSGTTFARIAFTDLRYAKDSKE